ncbi:MAG: HEAT repeat domain-containing protein [Myxococcota bacterium]
MKVFPRWGATLAVLYAAGVMACQGPVTEEDLHKWTHNDLGIQRIGEVVSDPLQPVPTRIRALEVIVEKGLSSKLRLLLDEVPESAGRAEVVAGLQAELLDHLVKKDDAQYESKDALMQLQRYVSVEQFAVVQKAVADWAFADVQWDTPEGEVKQRVERRMTSGQIADLGPEGWRGAAVLVSYGLAVDRMLTYLTDAKDPEATKLLLEAMKRLHSNIGVRIHHLEALARTESPAAATYLLDIYLDDTKEADIRNSAFNAAIGMLEAPALAKDSAGIVERLLKLMEAKQPGDRWLGALNIIRLDGVGRLEDVLKLLKDDVDYSTTDIPARKSVMDLCLDVYDGGHAERAVPIFMKHATDSNPVVAAVSIVCLKANQAQRAKPVLEAIVGSADEAVTRPLTRFLGESMTLAGLARNAAEGLTMMSEVDAAAAAGKLDAVRARNKKLIITFAVDETGEAYTAVVAERYDAFDKEFRENPDAFK